MRELTLWIVSLLMTLKVGWLITISFKQWWNTGIQDIDSSSSKKQQIVTKRRLTASVCPEGNRRDCNMSGNQTSGKEGGVQCVLMGVCMYVYMYA